MYARETGCRNIWRLKHFELGRHGVKTQEAWKVEV